MSKEAQQHSPKKIDKTGTQSLKMLFSFRNRLHRWYVGNNRPFPWRINPTPYRVWISEIMLQQTQAKTVIPYYDRFLKHFPDIVSLAGASEEEVLSLWSGLGYYSRARNIYRTAQHIVEFHEGTFPTDYRTILSLPGIGRYTAGAICSIALNQPLPIVDGNIRRVIVRLEGIRSHIPEKYFWDRMTAWVPENRASVFNQAMMELGATICLPNQPLCLQCPVHSYCRAKKQNLQNCIPLPKPKPATENVELTMLVLKRKSKVLLSIQENSFIPGQWGLPYVRIEAEQSPENAALSLNKSLFREKIPITYQTAIRHSITNRRILTHVFCGEIGDRITGIRISEKEICWATGSKQDRLLTSSLFRKAIQGCNE